MGQARRLTIIATAAILTAAMGTAAINPRNLNTSPWTPDALELLFEPLTRAVDDPDATPLTVLEGAMLARGYPIPDAALLDAAPDDAFQAYLAFAFTAGKLPHPDELGGAAADFSRLTPEAQGPVSLLLHALAVSTQMHADATRHLTLDDIQYLSSLLDHDPIQASVLATQSGVLARVDEAKMTQAAWIMQAAIEKALPMMPPGIAMTVDDVGIETPLGTLRIGTTQDDFYDRDYWLSIDPAGNDVYYNKAGAGAIYMATGIGGPITYFKPISVHIDLAGDDYYTRYEDTHLKAFGYGSGYIGVGIHVDAGGNDTYIASASAIGDASMAAVAIHWNRAGSDYRYVDLGGGGYGATAISILMDDKGDDEYDFRYYTYGAAGVGGVGVFIDKHGTDEYGLRSGVAFAVLASFGLSVGAVPSTAHFRDHGSHEDAYPVHERARNNHTWENFDWGYARGRDK